ncbi:MAG: hypothetical protein ACOC3W_01065 [Thermodesulfobacteriota bacterium]
MSCRNCNDENRGNHKTDFGAFVRAYRYTRDKPDLRRKVIRKARQLFMIERPKEKNGPVTEESRRPT